MHLSQETVEFFDKRLGEVAKKFRPADGSNLKPESAEEPFKKIIEQSLKRLTGSVNNNFITQRVQEHVYGNADQEDETRVASIIMFALDYYSRPYLVNKGYSEEEAHNLWSLYMANGGDLKLFEVISDFDGSQS